MQSWVSRLPETKKRALKRHLTGFETEFMILDEEGRITYKADELLEKIKQEKIQYPACKEYAHNMIEISSEPKQKLHDAAHGWLQSIDKIIEVADREELRLYPLGTYPGKFSPAARTDEYYRMCEDVIGPKKYLESTGKVLGFHLHYCLPYGTFDRKSRMLRPLFRSKNNRVLLSIYNSIIAIDPAASALMASSPFLDGETYGKSSRILSYRAMSKKNHGKDIGGLYEDHKIFGGLPRYAMTGTDLILRIERQRQTFVNTVEEEYPHYLELAESLHPLRFYWGALRINRYGTFEYRGPDMNLPTYLLGTSLLIKYFLKRIRTDELLAIPSDVAMKQPFRVEGNILHLPPFNYVNEVLQPKSATDGLDDKQVWTYTKRFVEFASKYLPKRHDRTMKKIRSCIEERKTQSDAVIEFAIKNGWEEGTELDDEISMEIGVFASDMLKKEVRELVDKDLSIDIEQK